MTRAACSALAGTMSLLFLVACGDRSAQDAAASDSATGAGAATLDRPELARPLGSHVLTVQRDSAHRALVDVLISGGGAPNNIHATLLHIQDTLTRRDSTLVAVRLRALRMQLVSSDSGALKQVAQLDWAPPGGFDAATPADAHAAHHTTFLLSSDTQPARPSHE